MTLTSDACDVRSSRLELPLRREALARPVSRHLLVEGVGYYADQGGHRHLDSRPNGDPHTRVYVCVKGSGSVRVAGTTHTLTAGGLLVIPAGVSHSCRPAEGGWSLWWCFLVGTDVGEMLGGMGIDAASPITRVQDPQGLAALMQDIADIYERDHSSARVLEAVGAAWALMTKISIDRLVPEWSSPLERAMDYLAAHLAKDVRVSDVAAVVGLSPSRLHAVFSDAVGKGVIAYQIELRMAKARRLLEQTDATVSHIGRTVGYFDPYYFSRHFRQQNGASPSEFRRSGARGA